ncbi:enoyl-CoA hydratase/isomerase family protein [Mycobacterium sp. NPDC050441]|uniref:enoyl-CoA hydratase/isomerase family protein n=1 Tax=Mycobacterium sp. NPDC050441 TaxID=3155403 RepID=UPI0033C0F84F
MSTVYETIRYDRRAHVGTLTLNRPAKLNALNPQMRTELGHLGAQLADDDTLRCLVVAGTGRSFSAGLDLAEAMTGTLARFVDRNPEDDATIELGLDVAGVFEFIPKLPCPSVAAVHGHAYGAGLQLALACDFRVFAEDARVGLTETRYGLLPDMGATFRLPRLIGEGRARELILLGQIIDAAEALRIGLANRVVPDDQLGSAVAEFAGQLAAQPPAAVRGARAAIDAGWRLGPAAGLRMAVAAQARCLASDEFKNALPVRPGS